MIGSLGLISVPGGAAGASKVRASFQQVGSDLFQRGLVSSHSGNLSLRLGGRLVITRHGAMLGHLKASSLVETSLEDVPCHGASIDLLVHRHIYRATPAGAIVHAHPLYTLALSLNQSDILPQDMEGKVLLERVPVIAYHQDGKLLAQQVAERLTENKIVVVRSHGTYSIGANLQEALLWTMALEDSSQIIHLASTWQRRG